MNELAPFEFVEIEGIEPLYMKRLMIEEGVRQLKVMRDLLDAELIIRMKAEGTKSFQFGENKIYYANKKTEKITDTRKLKAMLFSEVEAERVLSLEALSDAEKTWKISKVREIQDTLGMKLIEVSYADEIKVEVINEKFLKKGE